jgi:hypothetical protein
LEGKEFKEHLPLSLAYILHIYSSATLHFQSEINLFQFILKYKFIFFTVATRAAAAKKESEQEEATIIFYEFHSFILLRLLIYFLLIVSISSSGAKQ